MSVVFDASAAILGALTDQPGSEAVRVARPHLHEHYGLKAPWLLAWEVGHVIHRKRPTAFGTLDRRVAAVDAVLRDFEFATFTAAASRATAKLADTRRLSFYDAAYLELASRDEVSILVTEDRALLKAALAALGQGRAYDAQGLAGAIAAGEL